MTVGEFDYHGAIIVVETSDDEIALVHPNDDKFASLPGDPCRDDESAEEGAVRIVREMTGLDVRLTREMIIFIQEGTPTGTMLAHGYVAEPVGGKLLDRGTAGAVGEYPIDGLPEMVPVRVAIKRVLQTYLAERP